MPKNEDGEFELVVGNKQLLSIVFILMVLFGVVFSMGYFLGRSNGGGDQVKADSATQTAQGGRPEATGALASRSTPQSDAPLSPGEAKVATPDAGTGSGAAPVSTAPVHTEDTLPPVPAAEQPKPKTVDAEQHKAAAAPPPVRRPEPAPAPAAAVEKPAAAPSAAPSVGNPSPGNPSPGQTFLQVAAVKKPQAQMLLDLLKAKGFQAVMVQVDGQEVYRTLVGPVKDAGDLARTKAGLEGAGFKPFVKKY